MPKSAPAWTSLVSPPRSRWNRRAGDGALEGPPAYLDCRLGEAVALEYAKPVVELVRRVVLASDHVGSEELRDVVEHRRRASLSGRWARASGLDSDHAS